MKKNICCLIAFNLVLSCCYAQVRIEPLIGYGNDLRNGGQRFKLVNTALQLSWPTNSKNRLLLKIERGWGLYKTSSDSSFTLNPSLPLYAKAEKRSRVNLWSVSGGLRLALNSRKSPDMLWALMYLGVSFQKISVNYQYDKSDYVILNPDKTQKVAGPFVSGGVEYMHLFSKGAVFTQVLVTTPSYGRSMNYPSSFKYVAPLSFNVGYSIPFSKKIHGK